MTTACRGNSALIRPFTFGARRRERSRNAARNLAPALTALTLLSVGCAGFSSEQYDGGADAGTGGDGLAPVVVRVSPADGSSGVGAETPVVVTFSEPVDLTSAEAAVHISGVPNDTLDVSLDPSGTVLTIVPRSGFAYATGTDPESTPSQRYTLTVGTALTDREGLPLAEQFRASFHTLRRITADIPSTLSGEYYTYAVAVDGSVNVCTDPSATFRVGRTVGLATWGDHYGIVGFENALPEGVVGVESASFSAHQAPSEASFYATGIVNLEELPFQSFDATVAQAPVLTELGPFTTSDDVEQPTYDVTNAVADSVARGSRSFMYRLGGTMGASNTFASFYCGGFKLGVTYLVP